MKISKHIACLLFFLFSGALFSQKANIFLEIDFWKTNPTIEKIAQKIAEGNDIAQLNSHAFDAVSYALIEKVDNKTVKHLLSKKGNGVNKLTHDSRTYIFWAAYRDNLEVMQYLVYQGAKTDIIDSHGYSLLNFVATTGQLNTYLYDFCIANGSIIKEEKNYDGANSLLLLAPHLEDIKLIDYFVSKGIDIKSTDNNGNGLFNYAVKKGNIALLKELVDLEIDYKTLNANKGNAMILASIGARNHVNTIEVFKYLESIGINPNITTTKGITPLHSLAFSSNDLALFDYFISKGVNINQANQEGNTALLNAAYSNNIDIIKQLQEHVNDINAVNKDGKSALTNAMYKNSIEVAKFLVEKGADVTLKDKDGNSLMYYVLKNFNSENPKEFNEKITLLTHKGLNVQEAQNKENNLFHIALEDANNMDLLKRLYTMKINVNAKNKEGMSPLHKAVMKAENDVVLKYLISIGANRLAKTSFGETVYDLAKENELLSKNNIDINFLK